MRPDNRPLDALRPVSIERDFTRYAEGSVLIAFGETKVICTASVEDRVPPFLRDTGSGWVTAEYSMLPRSAHDRIPRNHVNRGRAQEISRLIGRSLRAVMDLRALGERSITIDCDVLQADGGTRTASITGAYIALADAIGKLLANGKLKKNPLYGQLAAVSVGIYAGVPVLDLDYAEDSAAETDMNVVMNEAGAFIEVQGTAEGHAFRRDELDQMLSLADKGIRELLAAQSAALAQ